MRQAKKLGTTCFETALGRCALRWSDEGIAGVELLVAGSRRDEGGRAPEFVRTCAAKVARHLTGESQDFADVPLDLFAVTDFHRRVYEEARRLGSGKTTTYGALAKALGSPGAARAVGQALARNPVPILVPCHRVVGAGHKMHGFSAPGGVRTKERLLALEGAELGG